MPTIIRTPDEIHVVLLYRSARGLSGALTGTCVRELNKVLFRRFVRVMVHTAGCGRRVTGLESLALAGSINRSFGGTCRL